MGSKQCRKFGLGCTRTQNRVPKRLDPKTKHTQTNVRSGPNQEKQIHFTFYMSSRDDLLSAKEVILTVRINSREIESHCYSKIVCSRLREALTAKCGVRADEYIVMQAWDVGRGVWGEVGPLLNKCCAGYSNNQDCFIHSRICRAELRHLLTDKCSPQANTNSSAHPYIVG